MPQLLRCGAIGLGMMLALAPLKGCAAGALVGGVIENVRRDSTRTIDAEYTGLTGKSFAVVVSADRMIMAEHPALVETMCVRLTERLVEHSGASGYVPPAQVIATLNNNPRWAAKPLRDLAQDLGGVDRLVILEISDFRLNDPGNQYLWDGLATGTVSVVEAEALGSESREYTKRVSVQYPDDVGKGPADLSAQVVTSTLLKRFLDRSAWPFYSHEEPYYPEY